MNCICQNYKLISSACYIIFKQIGAISLLKICFIICFVLVAQSIGTYSALVQIIGQHIRIFYGQETAPIPIFFDFEHIYPLLKIDDLLMGLLKVGSVPVWH